jgi:hypothetical protein
MRKLLKASNLNARPYIHGTSLVEGVLASLDKPATTHFTIRLHSKLLMLPEIEVSEAYVHAPDKVASGAYCVDHKQYFFNVFNSNKQCKKKKTVDEQAIEARIAQVDERYVINGLTPKDAENVLIYWSAIERTENLKLFKDSELYAPGKQMWFTGITLDSLAFLAEPITSVSSSISYTNLSKSCINRLIYCNDKLVGSRTAVYA